MRLHVEGIEFIAEADSDTATDMLCALWEWEEQRDEPTPMIQGVLNLVSNRKQDLENVKWLSGERFAAFVEHAGLRRALRVVVAVVRGSSPARAGIADDPLEAFGATGRLLTAADDLDYGAGHGVAAKVVDAFVASLDAHVTTANDIAELIREMVASIDHPQVWRRLIEAACERPAWWRPVAEAFSSGGILVNFQTRAAAGRLVRALSPTLSPRDHAELLETPIRRAAALFPSGAEEWRDRAVDQLLLCLDVFHVQDESFRERINVLLEANDTPPIPEPSRPEAYSRALTMREVIGEEAHDQLDDAARAGLEDIYETVREYNDNPSTDVLQRLGTMLIGLPAAVFEFTREPIADLVMGAAERLSRASFVTPDSELGGLVFRILIESAGHLGAE
jgi:hypothetical protein